MAYELSDVFIGNFPVTQDFGANPDVYAARYGLRGHNGTDFGCPSLTPVLAAADGFVSESGFDAGGYGNYVKIVHNGYLTLYGHLNDIAVKLGDKLIKGQLIGHSNNTGFSSGPHLHFGVAPCDAKGVKTQPDNGFSGYIDPQGPDCHWTISNPTAPVLPSDNIPSEIPVPTDDFNRAVAQGTNYKVIAQYALQNGANDFLENSGQGMIDLTNNPNDPKGGEKVAMWIGDLLGQIRALNTATQKAPDTSLTPAVDAYAKIQQATAALPTETKQNIFQAIGNMFANLFFTQQ